MKTDVNSMNPVCRAVKFTLRIIGIWPGTPYAIMCRVLSISSLVMLQIYQYRYIIIHFTEQDLSVLIDVLSINLAYSLLLFKLTFFAFNTRLLNKLIVCMDEDWKERNVSDEYMMTRIAYMSRWFSNLVIFSNATAAILYATGILLRHKSGNQTDAPELIVKMELPFKIESTSVYIAILVIQFVHLTSASSIMAVISSLLIILVLHTSGQIDIMRQKLGVITHKDIEQSVTKSVIKTLVVRHQKIIFFSNNIEVLFSKIVLMQFVSTTLIMCFLGFLIVISIGVPNGSTMLIKSVLFYININVEVFTFCFLGELLTTKSRMIGDAVYESIWYDLSPTQNRGLLLMILGSQKHLAITVGKVMDLSLMQFASIMKVSASYISVLHAMT